MVRKSTEKIDPDVYLAKIQNQARKSEATVEYEKQIQVNSLRPHDLSPWDKKHMNPLHFVRKKKKSSKVLQFKLKGPTPSMGKVLEEKNRNSIHN